MQLKVCIPNPTAENVAFLARLTAALSAAGHSVAEISSVMPSTAETETCVVFADAPELLTPRTVYVTTYDDTEIDRILAAIGGKNNMTTLSVYGMTKTEAEVRLKGHAKRIAKIAVEENEFGLYVRVFYSDRAPKLDVDAVVVSIAESLGSAVYAHVEMSLQTYVIQTLLGGKRHLSIAESFTGGGVSAVLTAVPRSSEVVNEGIVAYTEEAKKRRLGVSGQTIAYHSAVSVDCIYQMAAGLLSELNADIVIATTGYAGPTGAEVGQCFVAVGDRARINIYDYNFRGTRQEITRQGVQHAIWRLMDYLTSPK